VARKFLSAPRRQARRMWVGIALVLTRRDVAAVSALTCSCDLNAKSFSRRKYSL